MITANPTPKDAARVTKAAKAEIAKRVSMPKGVYLTYSGTAERTREGRQFIANGTHGTFGASNLKNASDAQLVFRFSDANLVALVYNDDPRRVGDIWNRARTACTNGEDFLIILNELTTGGQKGHEAGFLKGFCAEVLNRGVSTERFEVTTLSKADILEYLPACALVPGATPETTWEDLHAAHEATGTKARFKDWIQTAHQADLSEVAVRKAAADLGHQDFFELLTRLTR